MFIILTFWDFNNFFLRKGEHIIIFDLYTFEVLLTVHLSIFISVINQLDAQNVCFTISLFHASTFFEHMLVNYWDKYCIPSL